MNRVSLTLILSLSLTELFAQEIPCRQWYYKKDRLGNEIKDICSEAWQINSDGQRHGRYISYYENGNTRISTTYFNGVLNGKYNQFGWNGNLSAFDTYANGIKNGLHRSFEYDGVTVKVEGNYVNDLRNGEWFFSPGYHVTYKNDKLFGKSKLILKDAVFEGNLNDAGLYNGKLLVGKEWAYVFSFPNSECDGCVKFSTKTKSFFNQIMDACYEYKKSLSNFSIYCNILNGDVNDFDNISVAVDGIQNNQILSAAKLKASLIAKAHSDSTDFLEAKKSYSKNLDTTYLVKYLRNYPTGIFVNQVKDIFKGLKSARADSDAGNSTMQFGSVSFKNDSYETDISGQFQVARLKKFLDNINPESIKSFIIIGHSAADIELGKNRFLVTNNEKLYNKNGIATVYSEIGLADLRFILTLGRLKYLYQRIKDSPTVPKLIEARKFWLLPAGTEFGEELVQNGSKQNIVQIVIITNDNKEINSEIIAVPYGTEFSGPVLNRINQLGRDLNYNFGKLIRNYLAPDVLEVMPPDYMRLATDPNSLANFKNDLHN